MTLTIRIDNPCVEKKSFCVNCNSHFMRVRPSVRSAVVSKRFRRDLKDQETVKSTVRDILNCAHLEFHEMHKFEKNIAGNLIFRAKKDKTHVVYAVDRNMRMIFVRAMKSFAQYKKFLEDEREILRIIERTHSRD